MKKLFLLLICAALLLQGCAKIFYSPDAISLARAQNVIAIAPPTVAIAARKNIDGNALIEQQKSESVNFQKEMYSWMLKRKMQGTICVDIQDVETTNAMLADAGYNNGHLLTPVEMCDILGVDGILTSNYSLSKPMSDAAAIAALLLANFWVATNEAAASVSIHDQSENKMIWNYDHRLSSTLGSPAILVDEFMRQASREMPYFVSSRY